METIKKQDSGNFISLFELRQRVTKLERALGDCILLIEAMASDCDPHAEYLEHLPMRDREMVLKAKQLIRREKQW